MQQAEPKREREEEENELEKKAPKFAKPAFQKQGNFKGGNLGDAFGAIPDQKNVANNSPIKVQHNHQQAFNFTNMGYNEQQLDILNQIFVKGDRFLLPQPQYDRMEKIWNYLDADKSGVINTDDFSDAYPLVREKKQRIFESLLKILDRDESKDITSSEFAATIITIALENAKYSQKKGASLLDDMQGWREAFIKYLDEKIFPFFENIEQHVK